MRPMTRLEIYDKPMCCSTGVCGPQVDPVLPRFAADLTWLREQGVAVERYNLAQDANAFATNELVKQHLTQFGTECLPLAMVDGIVVNQGSYPTRQQLAHWCQIAEVVTPTISMPVLSIATATQACCDDTGCCEDTDP
jgi:hypothetical protein